MTLSDDAAAIAKLSGGQLSGGPHEFGKSDKLRERRGDLLLLSSKWSRHPP